jgi:hypothetical protein
MLEEASSQIVEIEGDYFPNEVIVIQNDIVSLTIAAILMKNSCRPELIQICIQ